MNTKENIFDLVSDEDIFEAYRRLKNIMYYDTSALHAKYKIAEFECELLKDVSDENVYSKIVTELKTRLNSLSLATSLESYISSKIGIIPIPKSVKSGGNDDNKGIKIYSNDKSSEEFSIEKYNYLIDAPIEVYIISVLWLMKVAPHYTHKISKDNYAYRFKIRKKEDEDDEDTLVDSITTYQPYFNGYKEWRDNAIDAAYHLLDKHNDATIVCLDIERYFYSMNLNLPDLLDKFGDVNNDVKKHEINQYLTNILQEIHKVYSNLIAKDHDFEKYQKSANNTMLPLGLPSSGIIANLFLADFDEDIKNVLKPEYYGRYVDDIILVLKNVPIHDENQFEDVFIKRSNIFNVNDDSIAEPNRDSGRSYYVKEKETLQVQQSKVVIEYISHKGSYAVLNNFRNQLIEQSSEFNYLPDIDMLSDFDDESFDIGQKEGIIKFRDIKNFKGNKYGASKFLSNRIILASLKINRSSKELRKEKEQILAFFKGATCIEYYSLWIKVATYFVLINDLKSLHDFYKNTKECIKSLDDKIHKSLDNYLKYSLASPLALNPYLLNESKKLKAMVYEDALFFRKSNLFQDYLVGSPLINYANYTKNGHEINFIEDFELLELSWRSLLLSPRLLKFYEICLYEQMKPGAACLENNYLERKYREYNRLPEFNKPNLFKTPTNKKVKDVSSKLYIQTIESDLDWKDKPKRKIAVANMRVPLDVIKRNKLSQQGIKRQEALDIFKVINEAIEKKVDILVLPEWCMPYQLFSLIIKKCVTNDIALITGMRYGFQGSKAFNMVATVLPIKNPKYTQALVVLRQKKHLAPVEKSELEKYEYVERKPLIPTPYIHFHWRNTYFAVYICFELADITERSLFKSEIDMMIVPVANKDTTYYDDIAGTVVRDLHCYYIQANTSEWGDSRITAPSSHVDRDIIRVKGGTNATILVEEIDIKKLREFEMMEYNGQAKDKSLKFTPPNFNREKTLKRILDQPMFDE